MASLGGPAMPLGYDLFPFDEEFRSSSPPTLQELRNMTGDFPSYAHEEPQILGYHFSSINLESPIEHAHSLLGAASASASDVAKSPGRVSQQYSSGRSVTGGSSSLSPGEVILTPSSTLLDYNASGNDGPESVQEDGDDDDHYSNDIPSADDSISPSTTNTTDGDFVLLSPSYSGGPGGNSSVGRPATFMNNRAPPSTTGSGVSAHPSRASSVAPSSSAASFSGVQWGTFTSTTNGWMENTNQSYADSFGIPGSYGYDESISATVHPFSDDLLSDIGTFESDAVAGFSATMPFRGMDDGSQMFVQGPYQMGSPFAQPYAHNHRQLQGQANTFPQQRPPQLLTHQQIRSRNGPATTSGFQPRLSIPSTSSLMVRHQTDLRTAPSDMEQARMTSSQMQTIQAMPRRSVPTVATPRAAPYAQRVSRPTPPVSVAQQMRQESIATVAHPSVTAGPSTRALPTLAKASPAVLPSNAPSRASLVDRRRGGRKKHTHLADDARKKSHKMRKVTACWRCALQRDPCDDGNPCQRCMMRSQKGQTYFFDCDRSKLPDFVHDFLPPSMTLMHQKQTIEDCVNDQVLHWDQANPIDLYLTSGYGPALRWRVHEFRPKTDDLLGQFQYLQNPITGMSQRRQKYSPPFGLMKLDSSDDSHFDDYLEHLLSPDCLDDFGWTCFEEETQVDPDAFQASLLDLLCKLHMKTHDYDLKHLLKEIIRMMIITYIMGHTLTILEDTLVSVLSSIRLSPRPDQALRHTSPRLANRQLKFFFSVLRNNIYEKILKWQQQTLHNSNKKEATWVPAFCVMLGFAMVLEEVQRTIIIQADAKATKGESTADQAETEAENACGRIDERFKLLVGLFQCKYRDKKWGENGSFGPGTPELRDQTTRDFLQQLRMLVLEKYEHLESRRDVQFGLENQCQYTSRLVARFLLPFTKLPPS